MFYFFEVLTVIGVISCLTLWAQDFEECVDVMEPDTFVSSLRSCSKYIFCDGDTSFEGECLGGNYFNEAQGICDDPENVACDIVQTDSVFSIFDEKINKSDVDDNVEAMEEDVMLATDVDVDGDVALSGAINEINAIGTEDPNILVNLQETPTCSDVHGLNNIHHIPHSESCSAFFTCYNGMTIPMLCPRNLYFSADTEKCVEQMPKNCKLRYSVRLNCRKGVYDYMPHPQRCEYYHYCLNGFLMIMRCPYDFTWHYERRTCVHKSQSRCYVESLILAQQPVVYRSSISDSSGGGSSSNS